MIAAIVKFEIRDEVKKAFANTEVAKKQLCSVIEAYKNVPGLKAKHFIMDPKTYAQGAFLVWETEKQFENYLKSDLYKAQVLSIIEGAPRIETFIYTGNLVDGVVL
jgi:hypothetical protein